MTDNVEDYLRGETRAQAQDVQLQVNGIEYPVSIKTGRSLSSVLRTELGLTGTKEGCDDSECGACMVLLDDQPVNSCSYLAAQTQGRRVTTIEGVRGDRLSYETQGLQELDELQSTLLDAGGVQCGFCTPGMIISAKALLSRNPDPSEDEVRIGLSGNLCRCTGYTKIVQAVLEVTQSKQ